MELHKEYLDSTEIKSRRNLMCDRRKEKEKNGARIEERSRLRGVL